MSKPTFEQGIQLQRNWNQLLAGLDRFQAQRLIEGFNVVKALAEQGVCRMKWERSRYGVEYEYASVCITKKGTVLS